MNALEENEKTGRRRLMGKATVIFLAVILLLTFFSNSINSFTLPKVTYETAASGALIKEVSGTGKVEAKSFHDLYVKSSMKVTEITVKVGDTVKQGQKLLTLDTSELENQIKDEQDKFAQLELSLEKLLDTGEKLKEAGSPQSLLNLDKAVELARQSAEKAGRNYEDSKSLYEMGAAAANELADAKTACENTNTEYEIAKNNREKALSDNKRDIENNKRDIETNRLNISIAQRKIDDLRKQAGMSTVSAPCDGIITELYYSEGMTANSSQPLYKIADAKGGFQFTAAVDISAAEYIEPGDEAELTISSGNRTIKGVVSQLKDNQQQMGVKKDVLIDISAEDLIGGESGTANIKKGMGSYKTLVSNSAVGQDNDGNFVYVLKERKGTLGNEFYVEKVIVNIGDSDNVKTAVLSGVTSADKIVSDSDKPLSDGSRVRIAE
ncbi:efflux RND transporter periplasmic adaptor subunit [Ruminiclostridium cellobioparum]|uniref:efflux RND transporter periplasmic adaptor subunit n=1 Tax=Ruminiclostridium cellobioparum TaxID=29355 RepID=UPI000489C21C|nr:efflux RND transporter periplasmic adaptor subunit [Ruminiclostridium cellobioparum]